MPQSPRHGVHTAIPDREQTAKSNTPCPILCCSSSDGLQTNKQCHLRGSACRALYQGGSFPDPGNIHYHKDLGVGVIKMHSNTSKVNKGLRRRRDWKFKPNGVTLKKIEVFRNYTEVISTAEVTAECLKICINTVWTLSSIQFIPQVS